MKRTHITTDDLKGVCSDQAQLFRSTFGDIAEITQKNMEIALDAEMDIFWLERLIPDSARDEYKKDVAAARAEYVKVWNAALDKYEKVRVGALVVALTQASALQQVPV